jgi:hypothetical protein
VIAALLLAAAAAPSAIDAEHAFARDAQRIGQWTAFRKWAAPDAVIFTPQAAWAQQALPPKDPPRAIKWAPAHTWVSCDGRTAVNTGPWWKVDGSPGGYFTTVWQRTGGKWRWVYDGGVPLTGTAPPAARPQTHRAACGRKAPGAPVIPPPPLTPKQARTTPEDNGRGESADKTLGWDWKVERDGARHFRVFQWTGQRYAQVLYNDVPAPPPPKNQ